MTERSDVVISTHRSSGTATLVITGTLDSTTYREVRDSVIKTALDEPAAVIVDVSGLDVPAEDVAEALAFKPEEWREEIPSIEELFDFVGEKLPSSLRDELDGLKQRLA